MADWLYDYLPDWAVDWVPGASDVRQERQTNTLLVLGGVGLAVYLLSRK